MADRTITRFWTLDLAEAGKVKSLTSRPPMVHRQEIVRFEDRQLDVEHFSYRLTLPDDEDSPEVPPTRAQYDAALDYYGEGPATRDQAAYLLSAWNYADELRSVERFAFSAPRRRLIHIGVSAFILSRSEIRTNVRSWMQFRWREPAKAVSIERTQSYAATMRFAADLIADMQGAGAGIFG